MKELQDYYRKNYPLYLQTEHWYNLKTVLIWKNPKAKCWICGEADKRVLLLHHVSYENLLAEVLYKDVYIICYGRNKCHRKIHFKYLGEKVKIDRQILLSRMKWLRLTHPIRDFRLGSLINNIIQWLINSYSIKDN